MRRDRPKTVCVQEGSAAYKINTPLPLHPMINCVQAASSQTAFLIPTDSDQIPRYHKHNPLCLAWPLPSLLILLEELTQNLLRKDLLHIHWWEQPYSTERNRNTFPKHVNKKMKKGRKVKERRGGHLGEHSIFYSMLSPYLLRVPFRDTSRGAVPLV